MCLNSTKEVMEEMAVRLRGYADEIVSISKRMEETGDISYAGECLNLIANMNINLRLDLLATRPIREMQRRIRELEQELDNA